MKFRTLFGLVGDAQDVVDFFRDVETVEQMISRLERLKKREADDFMVCIQSLKISIESAMEDTLEMGGNTDVDEDEVDGLTDEELGDLDKGDEEKNDRAGP